MEISTWDKEADVVVVGYGCAGAVAAITAHDEGARVLILEKAANPGGILVMIVSGSVLYLDRYDESAVKYFDALCGGRVDGSIIKAFVNGLAQNLSFTQKLLAVDGAEIEDHHIGGVYPFEGRETLRSFRVSQVPGFAGFPWLPEVLHERPGGQKLFKVLMDNVNARGIPVRLSTPVSRLITDSDGGVVGVAARSGGTEMAIKAKEGVVLACGGFEQNEWLIKQHFEGKPIYSVAPLTNTGDGIIMAQKVGAAVWHMWHVHGTYGFKFPEYARGMTHSFAGPRDNNKVMPWIVVDKFGRRYMNEDPPIPPNTPFRNMQLFNPDLPGYPYIPSYMIFDEEGRKLGPVGRSYEMKWSNDNSQEIKRGWLVAADTVAGLASKLKASAENEGRMEPGLLTETVEHWNRQVGAGKDILGRPATTMLPIKTPPFYGGQLWPVINNTQGGPVHDAEQRILDSFGQPIPRLYRAGEMGCLLSHLYQPGSNLGECFASGRLAAKNAARQEPWS